MATRTTGGTAARRSSNGLLCDKPGRSIAVEVFPGELHDQKTLPSQVAKLKERLRLASVVVVSDRGMVTKANIELLRETDGAVWITALKAPQIKRLVAQGALQLSLFDQHNLAEITAPEDYQASASSSAATRSSPPSAHANARSCCRRPNAASTRSQPRRTRDASRRGRDRPRGRASR